MKERDTKLICGVEHTLVRCTGCDGLVWAVPRTKTAPYLCDSCLVRTLAPGQSCGGGTRTIRKGEPYS